MPHNSHQSAGLLQVLVQALQNDRKHSKLTTWAFILEPNLQFSDTRIILFIAATLGYMYRQTLFSCALSLIEL